MYITPHALDRYRLHHPRADIRDVLVAVRWGTPETPAFAQAITGRRREDPSCAYVVAPDSRGMFVIHKENDTLITYLPFLPRQQAIAKGQKAAEAAPVREKVEPPAPRSVRMKNAAIQRRAVEHQLQLEARYMDLIKDMSAR